MQPSGSDLTAEALLRAAHRDHDAFGAIVSRYHLDLVRLAYVICGERGMAEDAAQNAWQRAWRKLDQVRDPGALRSWLLASQPMRHAGWLRSEDGGRHGP